ncbi:MAG: hypothetical protein M3083_00650 [Actinomycetota bacterium]|nr:hypothetical protein [Actinomycetota bacterium]
MADDQTHKEMSDPSDRCGRRHAPESEVILSGPKGSNLGDQIRDVLIGIGIKNSQYVVALERCQNPPLVESEDLGGTPPEDLQCDGTTEVVIEGLVDRAIAATTEPANDLIAVGEERSHASTVR